MANIITAGNSTNGGTAISTDTSGTLNIVTGSGSGANAITIDASQVVTIPGNLTVSGTLNAGAITNTTGSFSGNLSFNSGYGSAAVAYGCRAWVNFNGTGTVAIRASGNVTSITDNAVGDYTVNFTTALPDTNYSASLYTDGNAGSGQMQRVSQTTSALRVYTGDRLFASLVDGLNNFVSIFR
jgi:hypothetical protein